MQGSSSNKGTLPEAYWHQCFQVLYYKENNQELRYQKRPLKSEFLAERKPSYTLSGKAIRYDCYTL